MDSRDKETQQPTPQMYGLAEELLAGLRLHWQRIGTVTIDEHGKLRFPKVSTAPGVYRFQLKGPNDTKSLYIGETDNLQRRFPFYRHPSSTQQTNIRLNSLFLDLLQKGGEIVLSVAQDGWIIKPGGEEKAGFTSKNVRRLFEQFAIVMEHATDVESLNR
jgi:hypothetical protein